MAERKLIEPDVNFIKRVQANGGESLKKCYQCATCSTVCELSPANSPFPRKEMLWAQWGQKDKLLSDPDIWLCHQCNDCTTKCPRGARPGDVLAAIRNYIYESYTVPSFMGRAMANPKALPLLILVPALIVLALVFVGFAIDGRGMGYYFAGEGLSDVEITKFVPAGITEAFFIVGNIIIFLIAFIGLKRFWVSLTHDDAKDMKMGFWPAVIKTLVAIFTHRHFNECGQNKPRQLAHMFTLFGFIGAMATAGLALFFGHIAHMIHFPISVETPLDFTSPIKILGIVSGFFLILGPANMIARRNSNADDVGADGYPDRFFLWTVFLVGLTGMISWAARAFGFALIAYPLYYVHIVVVFMLLWYMPYSKFAHMLYRTMAMVWATQHGRQFGLNSGGLEVEETPAETEVQAAS